MKRKRACVVINPHAGQNVTQIADLIAVLSAAGWSNEIVIKEYGGHSMELATRAAKANYGLVIGYGGDGTLNQVLNGVISTRKHSSLIGVIPGELPMSGRLKLAYLTTLCMLLSLFATAKLARLILAMSRCKRSHSCYISISGQSRTAAKEEREADTQREEGNN